VCVAFLLFKDLNVVVQLQTALSELIQVDLLDDVAHNKLGQVDAQEELD